MVSLSVECSLRTRCPSGGLGHALDRLGVHVLAGQVFVGAGGDPFHNEAALVGLVAHREVDDEPEVVRHMKGPARLLVGSVRGSGGSQRRGGAIRGYESIRARRPGWVAKSPGTGVPQAGTFRGYD